MVWCPDLITSVHCNYNHAVKLWFCVAIVRPSQWSARVFEHTGTSCDGRCHTRDRRSVARYVDIHRCVVIIVIIRTLVVRLLHRPVDIVLANVKSSAKSCVFGCCLKTAGCMHNGVVYAIMQGGIMPCPSL